MLSAVILTFRSDHWVDFGSPGCFCRSRHTIESLSALQIDDWESLSARTKKRSFFFKVRWESLSQAYQPQNQAQVVALVNAGAKNSRFEDLYCDFPTGMSGSHACNWLNNSTMSCTLTVQRRRRENF